MNTNPQPCPELAVVETIAKEAGEILLQWSGKLAAEQIQSKSAQRDLVTAADLASEAFLGKALEKHFPGQALLAEEGVVDGNLDLHAETLWCVDPLDGTVNFVHQLPMFAVSIARLRHGEPELAVVHLPRLGETFSARRQGGAYLNGQALQVSAAKSTEDALLATGFPYRRHLLADNNLENFCRLFLHQRGIRRMGSAAIDLAYVAAGRLDGFWELHLSPWDVAAGGLLVQEAGGVVDTMRSGGDWLFGRNLLAGSTALVADLRSRLLAGQGEDFPNLGDRLQSS